MFQTTRQERIIIVFILASLITGIGIRMMSRTRGYDISRALILRTPAAVTQTGHDSGREDEASRRPVIVDINTASVDELVSLNGIGVALARRIVEYRTANGPFVIPDEIKKVRGIGDGIFLENKGRIRTE